MKKYLWFWITVFISIPGFLFPTNIRIENSGSPAVQARIISIATELLGTPYKTGGIGEGGVDCSGLVYYTFNKAVQLSVPRLVTSLMATGEIISGSLQPADLLFFDTTGDGTASHVGISLGDNQFIHAASAGSKTGVIVSSLNENYYRTRFLQATRIIQQSFPLITIEIDQENATRTFNMPLTPGVPVYFTIKSKLTNTDFIVFKAIKSNEEIITKRFRNHLGAQSIKTWFIPDADTWTILLTDDIKEELARVKFSGTTGGS